MGEIIERKVEQVYKEDTIAIVTLHLKDNNKLVYEFNCIEAAERMYSRYVVPHSLINEKEVVLAIQESGRKGRSFLLAKRVKKFDIKEKK